MSPSTLRSALILAASAGVALLTSCSSTSGSTGRAAADFVPMPALPSPVKPQHSVTITPSKARPGARRIQYSIIEIRVPEKGGEPSSRRISVLPHKNPARPSLPALPLPGNFGG